MSSLFKTPKMPKTALPVPEAQPIPEVEEPDDIVRFMRKRRGRAGTILTGALEPMDTGKRTLLG